MKQESRKAYERSQAPATTFKTPAGKEIKIDPKDKEISYLRGRLDQSKWETRQRREDTFYHSYSSRPLVVYNDCYHPYWNYYLINQPLNDIAMWIYMHQLTMDAARLNWYYSQNLGLQAKVAALEARHLQRDPTWMPAGVDADMAYNDSYVNAAFNPTPRTVTVYEYGPEAAHIGWVLLWIFVFIPLIIAGLLAIYYLAFQYRW